MVPYVRKSFVKHYQDGLVFVEEKDMDNIDYEIETMMHNATQHSINDREYEAYAPKAYKYAIAMTTKELKQAVEGMYHNLKIWAA